MKASHLRKAAKFIFDHDSSIINLSTGLIFGRHVAVEVKDVSALASLNYHLLDWALRPFNNKEVRVYERYGDIRVRSTDGRKEAYIRTNKPPEYVPDLGMYEDFTSSSKMEREILSILSTENNVLRRGAWTTNGSLHIRSSYLPSLPDNFSYLLGSSKRCRKERK